jgi:hypothetical protein
MIATTESPADPVALLAPALALGAAEDVVRRDPEKARGDLGKGELLAIALFTRIGREQLHRLIRDIAVGIELEPKGREEAFSFRITRRTVNDQRDDRPLVMARLEEADFLVDIAALGGGGRAYDDQRVRSVERRLRLI